MKTLRVNIHCLTKEGPTQLLKSYVTSVNLQRHLMPSICFGHKILFLQHSF